MRPILAMKRSDRRPTAVDREALRERLVELILGHDIELTGEEVSSRGDFDYEEARRLWRALGFPDVSGEAAFGQSDVKALGSVRQVTTLSPKARLAITPP